MTDILKCFCGSFLCNLTALFENIENIGKMIFPFFSAFTNRTKFLLHNIVKEFLNLNITESATLIMEEARVNIAPVTGKTMESCVQTYDSRLEKLADCNHMKVLVFGENLMEDTGRYADVLSYLKQTGLFPRNIYVCVAEDPLALFETEEDLPQDLGSYLEQYLQNQESAGSGKLFKLGRLLDEKENHILQIMLPYLETEDHIIFWKTMYRVPDDRFLYKQEK